MKRVSVVANRSASTVTTPINLSGDTMKTVKKKAGGVSSPAKEEPLHADGLPQVLTS